MNLHRDEQLEGRFSEQIWSAEHIQDMRVGIVYVCETDVFSVKAYHARCPRCGWQTKRYDHEAEAIRKAKGHVCQ